MQMHNYCSVHSQKQHSQIEENVCSISMMYWKKVFIGEVMINKQYQDKV